MPYDINTEQGEVKVTNYKFNAKFDKKLLDKPEIEKK